MSSQSRFFRGKNVVRVHEITNEAVYSLPKWLLSNIQHLYIRRRRLDQLT